MHENVGKHLELHHNTWVHLSLQLLSLVDKRRISLVVYLHEKQLGQQMNKMQIDQICQLKLFN